MYPKIFSRTIQKKHNRTSRAIRTFFACGVCVFLCVTGSVATHAFGCCERLVEGKTSCTDPSCATACFSMPDKNACLSSVNTTSFQWNSGSCWGLPECVGKVAPHCCVAKKNNTETICYASISALACTTIGTSTGGTLVGTFKEEACSSAQLNATCEGHLEDPNMYGTSAGGGDGENRQIDIVPPKPIIPQLAIEIPGLKPFTGPGGSFKDGYIIPYIGQYIAGVYAFATGAVVTLAIAMIIFAGIKWQTAGGDTSRISSAKTTMSNAVIGLILAFGTYLILYTLNPALVEFKALRVTAVQGSKYIKGISAAACTAMTGAPVKSSQEIEALAKKIAEKTGIPELPCIVIASIRNESGGQQCVVGHDENATSPEFSVETRRKFQKSGTFFSGKTFTAVDCNDRSCQNQGPVNDDEFKPDAPPDYGLDWRFSHGFGPGQSTIKPNDAPCSGKEDKGRGFRNNSGGCYTIPELLSAETSVEIMVKHFKSVWTGDPRKAFVAYAGKIDANNPIIEARMKAYEACRSGK